MWVLHLGNMPSSLDEMVSKAAYIEKDSLIPKRLIFTLKYQTLIFVIRETFHASYSYKIHDDWRQSPSRDDWRCCFVQVSWDGPC